MPVGASPSGLPDHDPEMSYTNWLDADAGLYCLCQIADGRGGRVVVKHAP